MYLITITKSEHLIYTFMSVVGKILILLHMWTLQALSPSIYWNTKCFPMYTVKNYKHNKFWIRILRLNYQLHWRGTIWLHLQYFTHLICWCLWLITASFWVSYFSERKYIKSKVYGIVVFKDKFHEIRFFNENSYACIVSKSTSYV